VHKKSSHMAAKCMQNGMGHAIVQNAAIEVFALVESPCVFSIL